MDADPDPVEVHVFDQREPRDGQPSLPLSLDDLLAVASSTLQGEGVTRGRLDVILVDGDEMAKLNETHMGKVGPTDVLSFPLDGPHLGDPATEAHLGDPATEAHLGDPATEAHLGDPATEAHLGDVVLCPSVAVAQAPEHCGTPDAEITLLVVHGVLHVLGHDHADAEEAELMMSRERHHLDRYGFAHPGPVAAGDRS